MSKTRDLRLARRVASAYASAPASPKGFRRTAGEIRFIKDDPGSNTKRFMPGTFDFDPKGKKVLAKVLWSVSCALGHLVSTYGTFTKIKSVSISPDGRLGGKGYIQEIKEIRQSLNTSIEALSAIQDTLNDELRAPHWQEAAEDLTEDEAAEVDEMMSDTQDIAANPEEFVEQEYERAVLEDID